VPLDVREQSDVHAAIAQIETSAGKLDALVNNAGIISPIGHSNTLASDTIAEAFEVNVTGVHRVSAAAIPLLGKSHGVIVNAGTGAATKPMEGWTAYCCSKAGARMLTQMFALELAELGIQSFFIGIPPTDTDMQARIRESGLNPISRIAQSDLVHPKVPASVMAWLCGAKARELDEVLLDVRDERFTAMMDL
jgi:NAD(P)-dependent dehydrogenase (short-subunit alcohol dehydrogenase family)